MGALKKVGDGVYQFLRGCLLVILSVMTVVGFLQVIFRYLLKIPLPWAEELIRYLFVWMTLVGGAIAVRSRAHIAMELLVSRLPAGLRLATTTVVSLVSLGFLGYLAVSGWQMTMMNLGQRTDALGIPMAYPYLAIPAGAVVAMLFLFEAITTDFREWSSKQGEFALRRGVK